jgi:hypothetical protein
VGVAQEQENHQMTLQDQYLNGARSARTAWSDAATSWTHSLQDAAAQARTPFALVNPTTVITQWATFARQLQQANLEYAVNLLRAVSVAGDAVNQHVDSVSSVVSEQVHTLSDTVQQQVDKAEQIVEEQAERIEQVERDQVREARRSERKQAQQAQAEQAEHEAAEKAQARQARAAERREAREAQQTARERYEDKTKAELAEELSARNLPKSGNVEELVERLVDADTK